MFIIRRLGYFGDQSDPSYGKGFIIGIVNVMMQCYVVPQYCIHFIFHVGVIFVNFAIQSS